MNHFQIRNSIRCERCNKLINPDKALWLELSNTDGKYYFPSQLPEGHKSQGGFSFGRDCATSQLRDQFIAAINAEDAKITWGDVFNAIDPPRDKFSQEISITKIK